MIINILTNTPFYVYWIFFSLLFVGISQIKTRQVGVRRAILIPLVLILLSVYAITHDFGLNLFSLFIWICGIAFIFVLDRRVKSQKQIQYSSDNKIFIIGGSYFPLFMMMLLFFTKYTVGVVTALDSALLHTSLFIGVISLLYGIFSGMYLIRFFVLLGKYRKE